MSADLKECPFCGCMPDFQEIEAHKHDMKLGDFTMPDHPGCFTLECPTPGCCSMIADTKAELVAAWDRRVIAPPVAARGDRIQESLVSMYRYKALPATATPGGAMSRTVTEIFESEADNTRIIIETSNGGASLRGEKLSVPVAAGSVNTEEFSALLEFYGRMYPQGDMARTAQAKAAIIGSITAWGAQQRQEGFQEGVAQLQQERDNLLKLSASRREWAEKAEARADQLSSDLLSTHGDRDAYLSRAIDAEARVKELQEALDVAMLVVSLHAQ